MKKIPAKKIIHLKSIFSKALGVMFKNNINNEAYVFHFNKSQIISIHMFFVFFPIDVILLDENKKIIEKKTLNPWQLFTSKNICKYVIEISPNNNLKINDVVLF